MGAIVEAVYHAMGDRRRVLCGLTSCSWDFYLFFIYNCCNDIGESECGDLHETVLENFVTY